MHFGSTEHPDFIFNFEMKILFYQNRKLPLVRDTILFYFGRICVLNFTNIRKISQKPTDFGRHNNLSVITREVYYLVAQVSTQLCIGGE